MNKKRISLYLTAHQFDQIKQDARAEGKSNPSYIVDRFFQSYEMEKEIRELKKVIFNLTENK
jgi:hypothetical protein